MTVPFQSDIRINLPEGTKRATIRLNERGDLYFVNGLTKLIQQLYRAIINEESVSGGWLNSTNNIDVKAVISTILRNFKQEQINYLRKNDPDLSGYYIWKKASGTSEAMSKISEVTNHKYLDSELNNGDTHVYGISRLYKGVYESDIIEQLEVTPTAFTERQTPVIGENFVVIPGDKSVTVYVNFSKMFKSSELISKIHTIEVFNDESEPRKKTIFVEIENLRGEKLSISSAPSIGFD